MPNKKRDCAETCPDHGTKCCYGGEAVPLGQALSNGVKDWPWKDDHEHHCIQACKGTRSKLLSHKWKGERVFDRRLIGGLGGKVTVEEWDELAEVA